MKRSHYSFVEGLCNLIFSFGTVRVTCIFSKFTIVFHCFLVSLLLGVGFSTMILLHSGKLLEYPNNPFAEEALILRAEVQFNQQNMAEALASYKMLKEKPLLSCQPFAWCRL